MEIHSLRVSITEQDLNDLARRHLPKEVAVEDLEIRIVPEGVRVKGAYQIFATVSFDSLWDLHVDANKPVARLASFKTMGIPANVLKSLVMNVIADVAKKETWLMVKGDTIAADLEGLARAEGLAVRAPLKAIKCEAGLLTIEAGD